MTEENKEQAQATEQAPEQAQTEKPQIKLSAQAEGVVKTIETMSVLELSELVKVLEDKFGVSAAMPMMAAGALGAGAAGAAAEEEEKTSFSVVLASIGPNKIQVIKEIRAITNLGLKEAKDLVDSAPKTVKEGATKEESEEIKKKLTAVGATIELK
ncbi:50S ribosomal protein L7/L12 [Candidatus Omnitrophota bacterium]